MIETEVKSCPRCGQDVRVNKDGSLRKHRRWHSGGVYGFSGWIECKP